MAAYVFLLLKHMANLEPNIGVGQGAWWTPQDAIEAVEGF